MCVASTATGVERPSCPGSSSGSAVSATGSSRSSSASASSSSVAIGEVPVERRPPEPCRPGPPGPSSRPAIPSAALGSLQDLPAVARGVGAAMETAISRSVPLRGRSSQLGGAIHPVSHFGTTACVPSPAPGKDTVMNEIKPAPTNQSDPGAERVADLLKDLTDQTSHPDSQGGWSSPVRAHREGQARGHRRRHVRRRGHVRVLRVRRADRLPDRRARYRARPRLAGRPDRRGALRGGRRGAGADREEPGPEGHATVPRQAAEGVKEDVRWAKTRAQAGRK